MSKLDQFHRNLFFSAKATMELGLVPCTLCGQPAIWEDREMVEYFCNPCLKHQIETGGEFPYLLLQQPHRHSWLEDWVYGDNGPMPVQTPDLEPWQPE